MENYKEQLEKEYQHLVELFGVNNRCWDQIHISFSYFKFCPKNQRSLIAEYLIWEEFVARAKKHNFAYYWGIDTFLSEYEAAVNKRLNLDLED